MTTHPRVLCPKLRKRIMVPDEAAGFIHPGDNVGMSGFTGSGYPKSVPMALAQHITDANRAGDRFQIGVWTGASTAPELDAALAEADGIERRLPFQADPVTRDRINAGQIDYVDLHLSHVAQFVRHGFLGRLNVALLEVTKILEDGRLVPSSSIGNNVTWVEQAEKVILEVNAWQPDGLEGMHDIFHDASLPPNRHPLPIMRPGHRVGSPYLYCRPEKIVAVVETDAPDRNPPFDPPNETSRRIADHILDFLAHEVKKGRLPEDLLPLQSGVGNIANAVMLGLADAPFRGLSAFTEVIQDGMLDLLKSGKLQIASATAFSLSPAAVRELYDHLADYRDRIILRPQEITNHPEMIRRLGCLAMNAMLEADIYGNVNSTHVLGSRIQNGIGGSGDFARNAYLSFFMAPSTAKGGAVSTIVPMTPHVDHTEHDVQVLVTEQGVADLRGLSPRARAKTIVERCAHPDFRPALQDYMDRALVGSPGKQTPHLLDEAFAFHVRFQRTGSMRP